MLQASIQNVSSVSYICCKCVYLDVVVAIHICCKRMFVNVSPVSDVYRNISRRRKWAHADVVLAGVAVPTCMRINRHQAGISRHEAHMQGACTGALACRGKCAGAELHADSSCMRGSFFGKGGQT
jgi:hypothetical protein